MYRTYYDYVSYTFQNFVNSVIPRSPVLAELYGRIQYYGALDLYTAEFLIMSLDSFSMPLTLPIAELLNIPEDRFLYGVGDLFTETELEDILPVIPSLNRLAMMGYYSEWPGYGSTRLNPPGQRIFEYYPASWEQIGYPGPSLGYRVTRTYSYV